MPDPEMIEYRNIIHIEGHASIITIPLQAVMCFLYGDSPPIVSVDGVTVEFRFAKEVMLEAELYYIENYPEETRAAFKARGLEADF